MERRQIAGLAVGALGVGFAAANLDPVRVHWVVATWKTPLIVVICLSIVIGAALGWLAARRRG